MKMSFLLYSKKIRIIIALIWVSLFTYFLYSWAKDDQTFEVGVAALALFASNIFSIIIPPKKDTFKIEVIDNLIKSDKLLKHILDLKFPKILYKDNTSIEKKINLLISRVSLRHKIDIKSKKILDDNLGEFNSEYEITYKSENLLCIKFTNYVYYDGAAHGNVEIITLNIKTVNSKIVQNNNTPNFSMKGTKKNAEDQKTLERKVKYKPLDIFSDLLLFVFSI